MARRSARARQPAPAAPAARAPRPEIEHPFHVPVLAAMAALLAARPWIGTDVPTADLWRQWNTGLAAPAGLKQGLLVVMLWLVLAAVWGIGQASRGGVRLRMGWVDLAMAALVGWQVVSGVWGVYHAAPRPAISALWIWIGFGVVWFLVRQVVVKPRDARGLMAVMLAVAISLAGFGLYQYAVDLPETRAAYDRNPAEALRNAGISLDSPREREAYENRLRSTEPFATFNLANSLAGFLAPWLLVLAGVAWTWPRPGESPSAKSTPDWLPRLIAWTLALLVAGCLVVTKSRAAWIAVTVGSLPLWWVCRRQSIPWRWVMLAAGGLAALAILLTTTKVGGLDALVFTQAWRSLQFRLEYWQASLGIVSASPWFGCGPGNFRDAYTGFKLETASEEVADPHNLFIEVWATAGTPALVAMLCVFGGAAWVALRTRGTEKPPSADHSHEAEPSPLFGTLAIGALCGLCVAWLVRLTIDLPLDAGFMIAALVIIPAVLFWLQPWIEHGRLSPALPLVAAAALGVNLLAAGGIGFPGVSESLWLLLALAVSTAELANAKALAAEVPARPPAWQAGALVVAALGLIAVGYFTAYQPVTGAYFALREAAGRPEHLEKSLESAWLADPLSDTPHLAAAEVYWTRFMRHGAPVGELRAVGQQDLAAFERHAARGLALRPQSANSYVDVGIWYAQAHAARPDPRLAQAAVEHLRAAVARYPNNAGLHCHLGRALEAAGAEAEAKAEAQEALRLDGVMPHADKRLEGEQKAWAERKAGGSLRAPPAGL